MTNYKLKYILKKILYGLLWLIVIALAYIFFKRNVNINYLSWLTPLFENNPLVFLIFLLSELIVGIIPPEVFMLWALQSGQVGDYFIQISWLALISYFSGFITYGLGRFLNRSIFFRFIKRRFFKHLYLRLQDFGIYLILIAAMTPIPYSGVCMLVGSANFPIKRFLLFSLARFVRFFLYAYIFWQINPDI